VTFPVIIICLQYSFLLHAQDIVIGTPGRLKDLIEMNVLHLAEVSFVVS
jgi:ATP-dependent RNA helicase DBP3